MDLEVQASWLNDPCIILYFIILEYFPIEMMLANQSLHRKDALFFYFFIIFFYLSI
jgi:hypothetical protein